MNFRYNTIGAGLAWLLDMLLPPRCPLCRQRIELHGHVCADCWPDIDFVAEPMCSRCALPFAFESEGLECGACLQRPPAFDAAIAATLYAGKGRDLVLALKHGRLFAAAPAMARMMLPRLQTIDIDEETVMVPVPLHRWRLLKRRFNQSQILAAALARETNIPLECAALRRIKSTPSQGRLGREGRFKNVREAFEVDPHRFQAIESKNVLLVDDVLTTGATVSACAKALKAAGARTVTVVAFARVGEPVQG